MLSTKIQLLMMQGKRKRQTAQGFTMVEVIVGILLTLIFTAISMQAVVMGTAVKVHGDEITDATTWIQQDLEDITTQANAIDYTSSTSPYTFNATRCGTPGTPVTSASGYASVLNGLTSLVNSPPALISSTAPITKTNSSGARSYYLVRTTTVKPQPSGVSNWPYNVLQISYQVYRNSDLTSPIFANPYYAEVIPGASFQCRK
jgi:Tfp pilus assembly protein PilE